MLCIAAALVVWSLGCGEDTPTSVGSGDRTPPDTLYSTRLDDVFVDSVFAVPGSLGRAPVGQIGQRFPYTAHILYAFRVPTRVLEVNGAVTDTLFADELDLALRGDSLTIAPFTGTMRIGVVEVLPGPGRGWTRASFIDSVLTTLPPLAALELAPDTLLAGSALAGRSLRLQFDLITPRISGYDTARADGDSVEINVAVRFEGFTVPGRGFLELPLANLQQLAQVIVFSNDRTVAIRTLTPFRSRPVVEFAPTYDPGTKLAVSDGYRLHTYLRFAPLRRVVPDSALVFSAELVLTQVDSIDGISFGAGTTSLGVVVPVDTTRIFSDSTANRPIAFSAPLAAVPGTSISIVVTPYIFDIQEGNVPDRGMILRVSNEGTRTRHFEFYGAAADSVRRPHLRIIYGYPAGFEGDER